MGEPGQVRGELLGKLAATVPGKGVCGQAHPGAKGVHRGCVAWECEERTKAESETNLLHVPAGLWDSFENVLRNNWLYVFCKRFIYCKWLTLEVASGKLFNYLGK